MNRPDYADHPGGEAARMAQHRHDDDCGCEPVSTPSPGWKPCRWRPLVWADVPLLLEMFREHNDGGDSLRTVIQTSTRALVRKIDKIGRLMAVSDAQLESDLQVLIAGYQVAIAKNVQLQQALDSADADKAAAVQAAIEAEDADSQSKIDAADAVVQAALNPPASPPADGGDTPPADGGDVPPADDGSAPATDA